jgi:5'(3')-deoxyribonucleotidase
MRNRDPKRLVVGVDLDDVVADLKTHWLNLHFERTGQRIHAHELNDWNMGTVAGAHHDALLALLNEPGFFAALEPLPGALEALAWLAERGHAVSIVSALPPDAATADTDKLHWLRRHCGDWFHDGDFVPCPAERKANLSLDVLIDDRADTVTAFHDRWGGAGCFGVQVLRPWNIDWVTSPYRVESLRLADLRPAILAAELGDRVAAERWGRAQTAAYHDRVARRRRAQAAAAHARTGEKPC